MKTHPGQPPRRPPAPGVEGAEQNMQAIDVSSEAKPMGAAEDIRTDPEEIRRGILELMQRHNIRLVRLNKRERERLGME